VEEGLRLQQPAKGLLLLPAVTRLAGGVAIHVVLHDEGLPQQLLALHALLIVGGVMVLDTLRGGDALNGDDVFNGDGALGGADVLGDVDVLNGWDVLNGADAHIPVLHAMEQAHAIHAHGVVTAGRGPIPFGPHDAPHESPGDDGLHDAFNFRADFGCHRGVREELHAHADETLPSPDALPPGGAAFPHDAPRDAGVQARGVNAHADGYVPDGRRLVSPQRTEC
jgi:hypothetical protein